MARTIKYLILSGDCVDGVGIYPGQDKELAIPDLFDQYTRFAELLHLLPDWVECIMLPGNHDAVRPAEPQPTFEPTIQQDYNTTTFVGNPCDFSLHGVRLLSYHGKSIDDFVATLRTVTYADPVEAMREMLRRRHLAPQWGGKTPLSPEPEDGLIIREVPDIFVTGHVHGHACLDHRGTTLVCSSTWQDPDVLSEDAWIPAAAMHADGGQPRNPCHRIDPIRLTSVLDIREDAPEVPFSHDGHTSIGECLNPARPSRTESDERGPVHMHGEGPFLNHRQRSYLKGRDRSSSGIVGLGRPFLKHAICRCRPRATSPHHRIRIHWRSSHPRPACSRWRRRRDPRRGHDRDLDATCSKLVHHLAGSRHQSLTSIAPEQVIPVNLGLDCLPFSECPGA